MSELQKQIKAYCDENKKTVVIGLDGNVQLRNDSDGKGDYIESWSVDGLEKPTDKQLEALSE